MVVVVVVVAWAPLFLCVADGKIKSCFFLLTLVPLRVMYLVMRSFKIGRYLRVSFWFQPISACRYVQS